MSHFLEVAIEAARKGGATTLRHFETSVPREVKADKSFVTAADKEAEAAIIATIKQSFPAHGFLAEESGASDNSSEFMWVIDPLDGTANFVNGLPLFSTSVALIRGGEPVIGVVYHALGDAVYAAERGKGATWKGEPMHVSDGGPEHAMVTFEPGKKEKERLNALFSNTERFGKPKRYIGSCALALATLARGGIEGVFVIGLDKWDYAAGVLLVEEAGGKITDSHGKLWAFGSGDHFIASNGAVHDALLALAQSI